MTNGTETVSTAGRGTSGLTAEDIVKRFSGVPALSGVTVSVLPGQVTGLVGHNGAGKSTLLKVLSGAFAPDEGQVTVDGTRVTQFSPVNAIRMGVSTVYQELSLLGNLSVTQNVFLGSERTQGGFLRRSAMREQAQELMARFNLAVDVDLPLSTYPVATRQLLELAVAVHRDARYLLLDEPTTSLEGEQVDRLLDQVRELSGAHGIGVLLVNHKLDELFSVAHRVVALVDGRVVIDEAAADVSRADVVRAIAGEEATQYITKDFDLPAASTSGAAADAAVTSTISGDRTLVVKNLSTSVLKDINVTAYSGRVLGIYGLVGSGRTEFLRAVAGVDRATGGSMTLFGKPFAPKSPRQAQSTGVVYLTEERKVDGIVPQLDSPTNVALPVLRQFSRGLFLNTRAMGRGATAVMDDLRVRGDRSKPVVNLSGGNQQKVLLARALIQNPKVLLLDEPTKGVDLGVKLDIHRRIRELAHDQGITVLLVSSEEDEILEASDDVVVFTAGHCDGHLLDAKSLTAVDLRRTAWGNA